MTTTTGTFAATDPGANKNCIWYINTNKTNPTVTLQFSALDFSGGNDFLTIFALDKLDTNTSSVVANFTNATGNITSPFNS